MPSSSKKSANDVRNVLLDRFLSDYEKDRTDGKTVRGLHTALEKHTERDDERFDDMQKALLDMKPKSSSWVKKIFARPLSIVLLCIATLSTHALLKCSSDAKAADTKAADAKATSSKSGP